MGYSGINYQRQRLLSSSAQLLHATCLSLLEDQKYFYRSFSSDVTAAILVYQNNEMAAILVYGTGISSFLFKYFVLFHHTTGATDHVSENDLYGSEILGYEKNRKS